MQTTVQSTRRNLGRQWAAVRVHVTLKELSTPLQVGRVEAHWHQWLSLQLTSFGEGGIPATEIRERRPGISKPVSSLFCPTSRFSKDRHVNRYVYHPSRNTDESCLPFVTELYVSKLPPHSLEKLELHPLCTSNHLICPRFRAEYGPIEVDIFLV